MHETRFTKEVMKGVLLLHVKCFQPDIEMSVILFREIHVRDMECGKLFFSTMVAMVYLFDKGWISFRKSLDCAWPYLQTQLHAAISSFDFFEQRCVH